MAEVVSMPKLGFDMAEGRLVRWVKSEGETVRKGEVLVEIETDKATVEVEAVVSGTVRKHLVNEGTSVPVGTPIAVLGDPVESLDLESLGAAPRASSPVTAVAPSRPVAVGETPRPPLILPSPEPAAGRVKASPVARRLAAERGLDLAAIAGSGPGGRVVKRDIQAALQDTPPVSGPVGETERIPVSKLRGLIGRRMTQAKQQVPHFYITAEIDAGRLMALREEWNALQPEEHKASVNDFVVKAAALALRQFPNLNASLEGQEIVRHGQVNVGVAVALEEGLLTVVCRNADRKSIRLISDEVRQMIARARQGKVRPDDIEGSTFSVSNLGMFDIDHFIAIVNPPEAAILAIGSVRQEPVVEKGQVVIGQRMKVTLSADHRVTDGAEGARWLQVLRGCLEHPLQLIL
jgi:pyruvate dehydrogenase E2 component (dihydrolipoamide acetyltransferase)